MICSKSETWPLVDELGNEEGRAGAFVANTGDNKANARRLVACWNACEGIEDPENVIPQLRRANDLVQQLEPLRIQRDELLKALRIAKTALVQWHVPGNRYAALDVINAAIAKAAGETP
jgi:hypothetical protein